MSGDTEGPLITELRPLSALERLPTTRIIQKVLYSKDGGRYVTSVKQYLSEVVLIEFTDHPTDNGPDRRVLKEEVVAGGLPKGAKPGSISDYRLAKRAHQETRRKVLVAKAKRDVAAVKTETKAATAVKKG